MNATATAQAEMPSTMTPPALARRAPASTGDDWARTPPQRLPVWDERARKMGFPPSSR